MKLWLDRLKTMKNGPWLLALACCAAALLLLPLGKTNAVSMTEEEQRVSATLSKIAGAGDVRVSIYYVQEASAFGGGNRTPVGAVIVAEGARSARVLLELQQAVKALLGLPLESIEVLGMREAAS